MLFSIIVPSRNQNRFLPATLDSIVSQQGCEFEIIVVDGASNDGSVDTLRDWATRTPRLRWISEPDSGPADAVNKGLAMARGQMAAIQSSDDLYRPGALSAVREFVAQRPDTGMVIGDMEGIDENGQLLFTEQLPEFSWPAYFGRALRIPQSSIFFRTELAVTAGGWNGAYYGCDLDLWLRLMLSTRVAHLPRVLSAWRLHADQRTTADADARIWDGYWRMIRDCQELRRAPRRVRRLALASRHLMAPRHHPTRSRWRIRLHLLAAFLRFPGFWRHYPWPLGHWIPGFPRVSQTAKTAGIQA